MKHLLSQKKLHSIVTLTMSRSSFTTGCISKQITGNSASKHIG